MNPKRVLGLGVIVISLAGGLASNGVKAQEAPAQEGAIAHDKVKKAEEQFKNIQVLKGVPAEQIVPTMQFISASLGVECEFCHVLPNTYEKDDKKTKQTARKMMEMVFSINADDFDRQRAVTCYTCHRGNAMPASIPPVMTAEAQAAALAAPKKPEGAAADTSAKPYNGPTADQLIDKYVQSSGGAAAINKITSRVMKGTIDTGGKSLAIDIYTKEPDERISFTHTPQGESVTGFNGHEGWLGMPNSHLREMHGGDLDGASIDADLHLATHFKAMFKDMKVEGVEKIGDHETYEVVGERDELPPLQLYFDQQSGLLVRMVRFGETPLGRLPTQIDYAEYRGMDGVKVPFRWTLARPSGRFTIQVSEMKQNVAIDDAKFTKPATDNDRTARPH
jgi:photosynthetic reaction center cytochrome c subunit